MLFRGGGGGGEPSISPESPPADFAQLPVVRKELVGKDINQAGFDGWLVALQIRAVHHTSEIQRDEG